MNHCLMVLCVDVHAELGSALNEALYSTALEIQPKSNGVPCRKEENLKLIIRDKSGHVIILPMVFRKQDYLATQAQIEADP